MEGFFTFGLAFALLLLGRGLLRSILAHRRVGVRRTKPRDPPRRGSRFLALNFYTYNYSRDETR